MKEEAYKGMRLALGCASSFCDPRCNKVQDRLDIVQNCVAKFLTKIMSMKLGV